MPSRSYLASGVTVTHGGRGENGFEWVEPGDAAKHRRTYRRIPAKNSPTQMSAVSRSRNPVVAHDPTDPISILQTACLSMSFGKNTLLTGKDYLKI